MVHFTFSGEYRTLKFGYGIITYETSDYKLPVLKFQFQMHARACTPTNIFRLCMHSHLYIQFKVSENGYPLNNDLTILGAFL